MKPFIAFLAAIQSGDLEEVQNWLADTRIDPSARKNEALRLAAILGHTDIVALLLADLRVDPGAENGEALWWATTKGNLSIVNLLLSRLSNQ